MIELTLEQRRAMATDAESPLRVVDPSTHTKYVLVPEEVYERVRRLFEGDEDNQFVAR